MASPTQKSPGVGVHSQQVKTLVEDDILCSQINLHHSPTANLSLNEWFVGRKGHTNPKIALVQEPHNHKGKISNISKSLNVFTKNNQNNIRACIITTSSINAWLLGQFSNEDQVAIAFKTNHGGLLYIHAV